MNFRQFLEHLEQRLGNHQLPLNPAATGLKDLFDGIPLHNELTRRLVRAIYEANGCRVLTDPVRRLPTLDALGPIRHELLRANSTDVDVYRLLEDLCVAAAEAFEDDEQPARAPRARTNAAKIIPLASFRRQRLKA